jgi:hypothetical protein
MAFTPRFRLPSCADRTDHPFIDECLAHIPPEWREYACQCYSQVYQSAFDQEPSEIKKVNAARRAANLWLLRQKNRAQSLTGSRRMNNV